MANRHNDIFSYNRTYFNSKIRLWHSNPFHIWKKLDFMRRCACASMWYDMFNDKHLGKGTTSVVQFDTQFRANENIFFMSLDTHYHWHLRCATLWKAPRHLCAVIKWSKLDVNVIKWLQTNSNDSLRTLLSVSFSLVLSLL